MIIIEQLDEGKRERRYSDKGVKLLQVETNILYDDAVDVVPCRFTYEESEEPIDDSTMDPQEALDMIFGGQN